jgi:hypothetical protein
MPDSSELTTRFKELDAEDTVFELNQLLYEADQEIRYWELHRERLEQQKREFINSLKEENV